MFCVSVLVLQCIHTFISLVKCFFPAYLTKFRSIIQVPVRNLVENELTVQSTELEHSEQTESAIFVSSPPAVPSLKLPHVPSPDIQKAQNDDVLTSADVDENIYSDIQQITEAEYSVIPHITFQNDPPN